MTNLLLLHGALGAADQFDGLKPHLDEAFTTHTLDFEGHGPLAPGERPYRIEHFVENVLAYLDQHDIARADIFGYSMGGYVGLWLAHIAPERVRRIMTLGTKFLWTTESAARENKMMNPDIIREKVPHFGAMLADRHGDWETVLAKTRAMLTALGEANLLTPDVLGTIAHPVRVAVGDRDATVGADEAWQVYQALPNAEMQVFPATPHPLDRVSTAHLTGVLRAFYTAD